MVRAHKRSVPSGLRISNRRWKEDLTFEPETSETGYVWTSKEDPRLTVEIHTFLGEDEDEEGNLIEDAQLMWYVYPAYDDRGLPNSPAIYSDEEDALRTAKRLLKLSVDELKRFDWRGF